MIITADGDDMIITHDGDKMIITNRDGDDMIVTHSLTMAQEICNKHDNMNSTRACRELVEGIQLD